MCATLHLLGVVGVPLCLAGTVLLSSPPFLPSWATAPPPPLHSCSPFTAVHCISSFFAAAAFIFHCSALHLCFAPLHLVRFSTPPHFTELTLVALSAMGALYMLQRNTNFHAECLSCSKLLQDMAHVVYSASLVAGRCEKVTLYQARK